MVDPVFQALWNETFKVPPSSNRPRESVQDLKKGRCPDSHVVSGPSEESRSQPGTLDLWGIVDLALNGL